MILDLMMPKLRCAPVPWKVVPHPEQSSRCHNLEPIASGLVIERINLRVTGRSRLSAPAVVRVGLSQPLADLCLTWAKAFRW